MMPGDLRPRGIGDFGISEVEGETLVDDLVLEKWKDFHYRPPWFEAVNLAHVEKALDSSELRALKAIYNHLPLRREKYDPVARNGRLWVSTKDVQEYLESHGAYAVEFVRNLGPKSVEYAISGLKKTRNYCAQFEKYDGALVDGDDYTWDWHAGQSEAGNLGAAQVFGVMTDGNVAGVHYDVRTGPERLSFEVAARLYAFERQLALLQQRVATLEAELDQWRGD